MYVPLRQLAGTAGLTYVGMGLSLVSTPLLAQSLGADGRGELAACFVAIQTIEFAAFLGLPRGVAIGATRHAQISVRALGWLAVAGTVAAAVLTVLAVVSWSEGGLGSSGAVAAAWLMVPMGIGQAGAQIALLSGDMLAFNIYRAWPAIIPSLTIICTAPFGLLTFEIAYTSTALSILLSALSGASIVWRQRKLAAGGHATPWRPALMYWQAVALDTIARRFDLLLAAMIFPAGQLGIYAVAATLAAASGGIAQAFNLVKLSRYLNSRDNERTSSPGIRFTLSLTSTCVVVVAVATTWQFLFGPEFQGLLGVTSALCVAQIARDQWGWLVDAETSFGSARLFNVASAWGLFLLVAMAALLARAETLNPLLLAVTTAASAWMRFPIFSIVKYVHSRRSDERRKSQ